MCVSKGKCVFLNTGSCSTVQLLSEVEIVVLRLEILRDIVRIRTCLVCTVRITMWLVVFLVSPARRYIRVPSTNC
jgi:hypothetical protein